MIEILTREISYKNKMRYLQMHKRIFKGVDEAQAFLAAPDMGFITENFDLFHEANQHLVASVVETMKVNDKLIESPSAFLDIATQDQYLEIIQKCNEKLTSGGVPKNLLRP